MTDREASRSLCGLLLLVAVPVSAQVKQPITVPRSAVLEPFRLTPPHTLAQVLAKPDATKAVLPDGKEATVGDIRRAAALRAQRLAALKTTPVALHGQLTSHHAGGAARLKAVASPSGLLTAGRKTYRLDGGRFYATRGDEFVVTDSVHRLIMFSANGWGATLDDHGRVDRWTAGVNVNCPSPSFDGIQTLDRGRGFTATGLGAPFGRTDSGDGDQDGSAGSRTFFPGYALGDWVGDDLRIRRGVWRSHTSPSFGGLVDGIDVCCSSFQIEVSVVGPLGVPFRRRFS